MNDTVVSKYVGCEWSASRPDRLVQGETELWDPWDKDCVGPSVDAWAPVSIWTLWIQQPTLLLMVEIELRPIRMSQAVVNAISLLCSSLDSMVIVQ